MPMKSEAPGRVGNAGPGAINQSSTTPRQNSPKPSHIQAARREIRIAAGKLSSFSLWLNSSPRDLTVAPALLAEISQQLWRASATLSREPRR
jgi:hypothetical protein